MPIFDKLNQPIQPLMPKGLSSASASMSLYDASLQAQIKMQFQQQQTQMQRQYAQFNPSQYQPLGAFTPGGNNMPKFKSGDKVRPKRGDEAMCDEYFGIYEQNKDDPTLHCVIRSVDYDGEYSYVIVLRGTGVVACNCFDDDELVRYSDKPAKPVKDRTLFESVVLDANKKEQILAAISQIDYEKKIFLEWGFGELLEKGTAIALLFYGKPGTGKTLMAQAIANMLGRQMRLIQTGEVESAEPGGAERAVKAFFENAQKNNEVILFDECDSLIYNRDAVGSILAAQVNALLTCLENYKGVVIFTTNRLGHLDPAFERRVSAKIEFPFPRLEIREQIWKRMIPKTCPIAKDVDFKVFAKFPIAGGNIKNIVLNAARLAAYRKLDHIDADCFTEAIEKEISGMKGFRDSEKQVEGPGMSVGMGMDRTIERIATMGKKGPGL